MKSFFSLKLYWEGVKKTRVVGIAFTAISTIISALIPFIMMLDWYSTPEEYRSNYTVTAMQFCIPALLIMIPASIILVLNMFSYLNKRSESDFYHAIPYKRSCVYVSFMAAVLSWLALASLLSIAFAAFFFWIHPGTSVALSIPFINLGICFLLGATLAATTAVAMTLTGTTISNLLIVILMLCFVPVVGLLFITLLGEIVPLLYVPLTPARFLQPEFSLPLAVFEVLMMGYNESVLFSNAPMIVYTVIVTLLLLVVGCLIYMFRKSEMASKSAPNNLLQHIYRCAVSLPFALFAVMMIYFNEDFSIFLVLVVITLLVYFMYELITTKRFKNLAKAIPFLGVLVAGCLVFVGSAELTKALTLSYSPSADELSSIGKISDSKMMHYYTRTYEDIQTHEIEIENPEAFEIISASLADTIERIKNDTLYDYDNPNYYDKENYEECEHTFQYVKITDKSGKVCGRELRMSMKDYNRLNKLFLESDDYSDALIKMPSDSEVQYIYTTYGRGYINSDDDLKKLWKSLLKEYNSLTTEQKLEYKSSTSMSNSYYDGDVWVTEEWTDDSSSLPGYTTLTTLAVSGTVGTQTFQSEYLLRSDLFPETCELYVSLSNNCASEGDPEYGYFQTYGVNNLRETMKLVESDKMNSFSLDIAQLGGFYYDSYDAYSKYTAEDLAEIGEIVEYMLSNDASVEDTKYYITIELNVHLDDYSTSHYNQTIVTLSEETYNAVHQMVNEFFGIEDGDIKVEDDVKPIE